MTDRRDGQVVTFYSYKGGTGRTMALANVAWILASHGKRVLTVDWDLESPGLDRYFEQFIDPDKFNATQGVVDMILEYGWAAAHGQDSGLLERCANVERYAFSLNWPFPGDGTIDFMPAGQQNYEYGAVSDEFPTASARLLAVTNWDDFYQYQDGGAFFDALRADMKRRYDYTLIDSRTGRGDVAAICTSQLPDVLVNCFTYSEQGIEGAAEIADQLVSKYRNVRVLPVPMRVDPAEKRKADAGRTTAMRRFAGHPAGMDERTRSRYWNRVQVPYQAFYAYEETLATFADEPGLSGSLLSAYENLTDQITDGRIVSMPPLDPALRAQVNLRFERRPPADGALAVLFNTDVDPVWTEWIDYLLNAAGLRVERPTITLDGTVRILEPETQPVLLLSRSNIEAERARGDRALGGREPIAVYLSDVAAPVSWIPPARSVFVAHTGAAEAAQRVCDVLGLLAEADDLLDAAPRFPDDEHGVFNAPPRNVRFTGREIGLHEVRDALRSGPSQIIALHGMGGVGKSQLALEYAHRYRNAYDLVHWLNSGTAETLELALRDLGDSIGLRTDQTGAEYAKAVINEINRTRRHWLLIFDNADDPHHLLPYLPPVDGHILVTSRHLGWSDHASTILVDVFTRNESVRHLQGRVATMTDDDADQIARELADLPLVVSAAGALLADSGTSARDYLRLVRDEGPGVVLTRSTDASSARTWDLSLHRIQEQDPAAYRLFQLCSVMAPEIALALVYSDKMAEYLVEFNPTVSDPLLRPGMIQKLNRLALLRLDQRGGQIMIHRVVQAVVRDHMTDDEQDIARRQVHDVLAAVRPPGEVDQQDDWPKYQILWPHLEVSDAVHSASERVRQLLIDRIRYLYLLGEMAAGREQAERIDAIWSEQLAALDPSPARIDLQRQLLQMRFNKANLIRDLGDFEQSRALNQEVYADQVALLGTVHPHTLMTAGGLAADLRGLGLYSDALKLDVDTHASWLDQAGEENPRTLSALNNLAVDYRLLGDFRRALALDTQAYELRRTTLGPTNLYTLSSAASAARDVRDAGDYAQSVVRLQLTLADVVTTRGEHSKAALTTKSSYAVALRSAGNVPAALDLHGSVYQELYDLFGPENPETVAAQLSLALSHLAAGHFDRAAADLTDLATHFRHRLSPNHPHALVCLTDLAIAERARRQFERASDLATQATNGLRLALSDDHPYTLSAQMNLAICLTDVDRLTEARDLLDRTLVAMRRVLQSDHPNTMRCEGNLTMADWALSGQSAGAALANLSDRLIARLGDANHPIVIALHRRHYLYRIIDPHPF